MQSDFVPPREEITTDYQECELKSVMLHDGSWVKLRKVAKDYDPTDRDGAYAHIRDHQKKGEVVTGSALPVTRLHGRARPERTVAPLFNLPHDRPGQRRPDGLQLASNQQSAIGLIPDR